MASNSNTEAHIRMIADGEWWKIQLTMICIEQGRKHHMATVADPLPWNFYDYALRQFADVPYKPIPERATIAEGMKMGLCAVGFQEQLEQERNLMKSQRRKS